MLWFFYTLGRWCDQLLVLLEGGSVPIWYFRAFCLEWVNMLSRCRVQMGFSSTGVYLRGVQADTTLNALPSGCAWFGRSLWSGTQYVFAVNSTNFLKFSEIPKFVPKFRPFFLSKYSQGDILSSERSPRGNAFSGHPERPQCHGYNSVWRVSRGHRAIIERFQVITRGQAEQARARQLRTQSQLETDVTTVIKWIQAPVVNARSYTRQQKLKGNLRCGK